MSGRKKSNRCCWTASKKLRIVLSGMDPSVGVSQLCRREGINPTQCYLCRKHLLSSAERVFNEIGQRPSRQQERLQSDVARAKDVIAEITSANLEFEKKVHPAELGGERSENMK